MLRTYASLMIFSIVKFSTYEDELGESYKLHLGQKGGIQFFGHFCPIYPPTQKTTSFFVITHLANQYPIFENLPCKKYVFLWTPL